MKASRLVVGTVITFSLTGCEHSAQPDTEIVRMGALFEVAISIPDTVTTGVPFEAVVTTVGNGCLLGADREDVDASSDRVEITPFDRWVALQPDLDCTDEQVTIQHLEQLVIAEPGEHRVVVRGLRWPWPKEADTTTVEVWITVVDSA